MKKIFILSFFLLVGSKIIAQSVTIDPANQSNIIKAQSTNQGIVIPKMTTLQKEVISSKIEGMMVYDTDIKQFSYWTEGAGGLGFWLNLGNSSGGSGWVANGNNISNLNAGNVGIGINQPFAKLHINGDVVLKVTTINLANVSLNANNEYSIDRNGASIIYLTGNNASQTTIKLTTISAGIEGMLLYIVLDETSNFIPIATSTGIASNGNITGLTTFNNPDNNLSGGGIQLIYLGGKWRVLAIHVSASH